MSKQTDLINIPDAITVSGSNVGIGTTSPSGNLEIATSASDTGVDFVLDGNKTSNGGVGSIIFNNNGDSVGMIRSNRASANDAAGMLFYTQATGGSNTERMRIDSSGKVGIGTNSPNATLTVSQGANNIFAVERTGVSNGSGQFGINIESNSQATVSYDDGAPLVFGTASSPSTHAGFTERMKIDSSGAVTMPSQPAFLAQGNGQTDFPLSTATTIDFEK